MQCNWSAQSLDRFIFHYFLYWLLNITIQFGLIMDWRWLRSWFCVLTIDETPLRMSKYLKNERIISFFLWYNMDLFPDLFATSYLCITQMLYLLLQSCEWKDILSSIHHLLDDIWPLFCFFGGFVYVYCWNEVELHTLVFSYGCRIQLEQPATVKVAANLVRLLAYNNKVC